MSDALRKPKLCIVSPYSYPLFNPECRDTFGGSEVQVSIIAKELAKRGSLDVCMLTGDHGQPHIEERDGVTLYSWHGKTLSLAKKPIIPPGVARKILWWMEMHAPWKAFVITQSLYIGMRNAIKELYRGASRTIMILKNGYGNIGDEVIVTQDIAPFQEINADIYMMSGNNDIAARLAFFCLKNKKKYVLLAASDIDYDPIIKTDPNANDPYGTSGVLRKYAIDNANIHIVQNEQQSKMLSSFFKRDCAIVRNPMDISPSFQRAETQQSILWVGKSDSCVKRPELILELARLLPQYPFTIIMSQANVCIHERCIEIARGLSNVTLHTYVPFDAVEKHFAAARIFISTSVFEGFPNTFLQAAKYGVPILSLQVDPGEMLSRHKCGLVCDNSFSKLIINTELLLQNDDIYRDIGNNCLAYVKKYHNKEEIIPQIEKLLFSLL